MLGWALAALCALCGFVERALRAARLGGRGRVPARRVSMKGTNRPALEVAKDYARVRGAAASSSRVQTKNWPFLSNLARRPVNRETDIFKVVVASGGVVVYLSR